MSDSKIKAFSFNKFDCGINAKELRSEIADNELYECVNMYPKEGKLVTREGLIKTTVCSLFENDEGYSLKPLGSVVYSANSALKLFLVSRVSDGTFYNKLLVLRPTGSYKLLELYNFSSSNYSYEINNINCIAFAGKAVFGSGVFVLLGAINSKNEICEKLIFELDSSFAGLTAVSASDIYAPLVLVNGRGESYNELESAKRNYPSPHILEDFNILSSAFRAAYKTDGFSSQFYLPAKGLSAEQDENIIITYTDTYGDEHELQIAYNSDISNYLYLDDAACRFKIDRYKGRIDVVNSDGEAVALPESQGIYNNLIIKAYKKPESDRIFKMTVAESFNSRVFLSGNSDEGNVICFSKRNNPLYFPRSNVAYFGDKTSAVTGIKQQNDRLILFKPHEIGICSSVNYSEYNTDFILLGKSNQASTLESMSVKSINTGLGCIYPETVKNCANRMVFLGTDNKVYAITSSSNYLQRIYHISNKIDNITFSLKTSYNIFAMNYKDRYMLFYDNKCFSFNYNESDFFSSSSATAKSKNNVAWYYFEYGIGVANLFSSLCIDSTASLYASIVSDDGVRKIVRYIPGGFVDRAMVDEDTSKASNITCKFSTKASNFGIDSSKQIVGVEATIGSESFESDNDIQLSFASECKNTAALALKYDKTNAVDEARVNLNVCLFGLRHFGLNFTSEGPFSVKCIKIRYK